MFENILSRRIDWHEGDVEVSKEARDFMEQLMTLDPSKRLGSKGAQSVKDHPFFKDINWDTLLVEQPSFVPNPEDMEDTDYFDNRGASMMPTSSSSSSSSASASKNATAKGEKIKEDGQSSKKVNNEKDKLEHIQLDSDAKAKVELANAIIQEQHPVNVSISSQSSSKKQNDNSATPTSNQKANKTTSKQSGTTDEIENGADFGTFVYKNLPVLERANEDTIRKIRHDTLAAESSSSNSSKNSSGMNTVSNPSKLIQSYTSTAGSSSSIPGTPNVPIVHPSQLSASQSTSSAINNNNRLSVDMQQQQQQYLDQQLNELSRPTLQTPIKNNFSTLPANTTSSPSPTKPHHKRTRSLSTPDCRSLPLSTSSKETNTPTTNNSKTPIVSMTPSSSTKTVSGAITTSIWPSSTPSLPPLPQTVSDSIIAPSPLKEENRQLQLQQQHKEEIEKQEQIEEEKVKKGLGFLVVDDNPISCKILETILNMLQYQCVIVRNGAQAIRAAMNDVKYDIIFMDIRMPISKYYLYIEKEKEGCVK